jgi:hypothetical protein
MEEQSPETRRRMRTSGPGIAFVAGLVILALVVGGIIVLIYAFGGFGEGSEGALGITR